MLGDEEHPISFSFEPRIAGGHVKVTVRAGQRGMRAYAGELTFRREEWAALSHLLADDDGIPRETISRHVPLRLHGVPVRTVEIDEPPVDIAPVAPDAPPPGGVIRVQVHDDGGHAAGYAAGRADGYAQGLADGRVR